MGKALRPLLQSAGEGWDGVSRSAQRASQKSPLREKIRACPESLKGMRGILDYAGVNSMQLALPQAHRGAGMVLDAPPSTVSQESTSGIVQ